MSNQIVTFVINRELDAINYFNSCSYYKRHKESGNVKYLDENIEKLLKLNSKDEVEEEIKRIMDPYYEQKERLVSLADDVNKEWAKIENDFMKKLEIVHKFPFPYKSVKGVLALSSRCGYHAVEGGWFAVNLARNKYICMDTATHELMHFMFHKYYDKICEEKGLSKNQMWDVKESFTVLLNLEFRDFRFQPDNGYLTHNNLREAIASSWSSDHDFNKALDAAVVVAQNVKV